MDGTTIIVALLIVIILYLVYKYGYDSGFKEGLMGRKHLRYKNIIPSKIFKSFNAYPNIDGVWKSEKTTYQFTKVGKNEYNLKIDDGPIFNAYYIAPGTIFAPTEIGRIDGKNLIWGYMEGAEHKPNGNVWTYTGARNIGPLDIAGQWDKAMVYLPQMSNIIYSSTDKKFDLFYDKGFIIKGKFLFVDEDNGTIEVTNPSDGTFNEEIILHSDSAQTNIQIMNYTDCKVYMEEIDLKKRSPEWDKLTDDDKNTINSKYDKCKLLVLSVDDKTECRTIISSVDSAGALTDPNKTDDEKAQIQEKYNKCKMVQSIPETKIKTLKDPKQLSVIKTGTSEIDKLIEKEKDIRTSRGEMF